MRWWRSMKNGPAPNSAIQRRTASSKSFTTKAYWKIGRPRKRMASAPFARRPAERQRGHRTDAAGLHGDDAARLQPERRDARGPLAQEGDHFHPRQGRPHATV